MVFFVIIIMLSAIFVIPRINSIFESQNAEDLGVDLALEAELFTNYINGQNSIIQDLAQLPSLVNAVMHSDASNPVLIDLFDHVVIGGEVGRLVLQDIAGSVVIQTAQNLQANYKENGLWFEDVLNGSIPYHFQLLGQEDDRFSFKISVPVNYNNFTEGVLSAEITARLSQVFVSQSFKNHIAFKLTQEQITVSTDSRHIEIAHEESMQLDNPRLTFVYITDTAVVRKNKREIQNTILLVLLIGLTISFLLFAIHGYYAHLSADKFKNEKLIFGQNYTIPLVVAAIGMAVSTIAFFMIVNLQRTAIEQKYLVDGTAYALDFQQSIDTKLNLLKSFSAFYDASTFVDRQEFSTYAKPFIENHPDIQALAWVPNVRLNDRKMFEDQAKGDGLRNFEFKELDQKENILRLAHVRSQYFPVFYTYPMEGNEKVLGFDLASNAKRLSALSKAAKTGKVIVTEPIKLVEESDSQTGVLVFYPVFETTNKNDLSANNEFRTIKGFLQLVIKIDEVMAASMQNNKQISTTFVQDITDSENTIDMFGTSISIDKLTFSRTFDVAGRKWKVDTVAVIQKKSMQWVAWLVLITGYIVSTLITIGLVHLIRRREIVELLVKQRTTELRMLSSIAANSNDIFIVTLADQHNSKCSDSEILYVNDAFTRFTGYSYDEAVGQTPRMLQGVKTDRNQLDLIRKALMEGHAYQGELINYTKNNEEYWVDINIIPLKDKTGKIIQYAAVQRDITERKQGQVERDALINKLTDSNEELARFAYVCSHDLQEPLRMVRSFSELLQSHLEDDLRIDEKGQKYFGFILDGATRAQNLISDILNYSSIDSDTQQLQPINSNDLMDSIRTIMQVSLQKCGGTISNDQLPELQGNQTQLYQLFQNIINNAIKYQKPDTSPKVHISVTDADTHWQFAVTDNGIGMEQRHLDKIFDVFQRLHRRSQYAGTGVGLSICKKVVERHGGTLWVESEQNVGTTFHFTLLKPDTMETTYEQLRKAG